MSADVQPRKRKDKKKKREDEEVKESHHGVHDTKMGADDIHLHIQADHSTGGHWCAKIFFFSLLAILLGLIGLIIIENRGLSDLDTPLSESRYSEYFEGWVDEHRQSHDDHHDKIPAELEDHDAEPFEEEEDHSEIDEDEEHDEHEDHEAHEEHEEHDDHEEEADATEDADDDDKEQSEEVVEEEENQEVANDDDDDDENEEDDGEDDGPPSEEYSYTRSKREVDKEPEEDDDDEDEGFGDSEDTIEATDDADDDDNEENTSPSTEEPALNQEEDPYDEVKKTTNQNKLKEQVDELYDLYENISSALINKKTDDNTKSENASKKDDDDFESLENVVDNDADEQVHLEQKAKQGKEQSPAVVQEEEQPESSSKIKSRQGGGPQSYSEDELIEEELRRANEDMLHNNLQSALRIFESLSLKYPDVPGALYGKAKALDRLSEEFKSNQILLESIWAYKRFLALDEKIDDDLYLEVSERCIDRMRFRGLHLQAVSIHHSLIKRFPQDPRHRNQLSVTYLLLNRFAEAKAVLNETLLRWPNNGFAQVHFGFVIKNLNEDYETAVKFLWNGIKSRDEGTQDGRFYFHLGDALQRLGRSEEARQIYQEGAKKKLFLSEYQRSLYNVENIKAQPFWTKEETGYKSFLEQLEKNWEKIRNEGLAALNQKGFFVEEAESLRDFGDWKQFELFARGNKNTKNCAKTPTTCGIIEMFPAARFCKRGQTKFSVMHPNTHVWPHCGPTNCRIRAHLGLKVPPGTKIRVAQEERTWEEGKFLIFDDSFEHEVWHNGTSVRLVLIVDVWHPELTEEQRATLSPI